MPFLYLHVGPHKTGSTYLQEAFARNAASLRAQGVHYPSIGRECGGGHHNIAWHVSGRETQGTSQPILEENLARLAGDTTEHLLLSSEEFARCTEGALEKLKRTFPAHAVRLIYFVRKGPGLIVSLWQEMVKHGAPVPLDGITRRVLESYYGYECLAPEVTIARFTRILNATPVVFDYERLAGGKRGILLACASALNVAIEAEERLVNSRMDVETIELVRAANIHSERCGNTWTTAARGICMNILKRPVNAALGAEMRPYLREQVGRLARPVPLRHFVTWGVRPGNVFSAVRGRPTYVPGTRLFDRLEADDILPWRVIKQRVSAIGKGKPATDA